MLPHAAKPQNDSTAKKGKVQCPQCNHIFHAPISSGYDLCQCGKHKAATAAECQACWRKRHYNPPTPGAYRKATNWYDLCPICGHEKHWKSPTCRQCSIASRHTPVSNEVFYRDGEPCRFVSLTQGQCAVVDASEFERLSRITWQAKFCRETRKYYAVGKVNGKITQMGRVVLCLAANDPLFADHRNGDTTDYRSSNLRPATHSQNMRNRATSRNNRTGYKGVTVDFGSSLRPYLVQIREHGRNKKVGRYSSLDEAARAYDTAALRLYGEFAHTNFPRSDYQ